MYRILRQRPDTKITLILEHWITGTKDYVINVSNILDYIEYSWKKDNLDDIDLIFDLGYMTASVKIDGWLINAPFDYEI